MKNVILFCLVAICSISLNAQDSFKLDDFNSLDINGNIKAELISSSSNKLEITDYDGSKIEWSIQGNTLKIKTKYKWSVWGSNTRFNVKIYYKKSLTSISTAASASLESSSSLDGNHIKLRASSGSTIDLGLAYDFVDVDASSGASVELNGKVNQQSIDISSGASYDGYDLSCDKTQVEASSGASADVTANKSLDAGASSGGSIEYRGNPSVVDTETSSGGSVDKG